MAGPDGGVPLPSRDFRVGLFGEFSTGKSTLINSLLKAKAQATGVVPVTPDTQVFTARSGLAFAFPGVSVSVHTAPLLELGVSLWDTPGSNSDTPGHREDALRAAGVVDLAVILVSANDGITRTTAAFIEELTGVTRPDALIWVVLTKADRVEFDDEEERLEAVGQWEADIRRSAPRAVRTFLLDARVLDAGQGCDFVDALEDAATGWLAARLLSEVGADPAHPLRQGIALGRRPHELPIPEHLYGEELASVLEQWREHCVLMRRRHRGERWRAMVGAPGAAVWGGVAALRSAWLDEPGRLLGRDWRAVGSRLVAWIDREIAEQFDRLRAMWGD